MASPGNRPPDPLERNGARRSRPPPNQRSSSEQSEAVHHSDDELFSARVSALIAERRRLLRRGLINRLQHLKAAILSSEFIDHHESAEQQLPPLDQYGSDFHMPQPSSSVLARPSTDLMQSLHSNLYVHSVQHHSKNSAVLAADASDILPEESTMERWSDLEQPLSLIHRASETDTSDTGRTKLADRVSPAGMLSNRERQMPPRRHPNSQPMHSIPTVLEGASGGSASTAPLRPSFPSMTPLPKDLPLPPSPSGGSKEGYEGTGRSTDFASSSIEAFGSQELRNVGFRNIEERSDPSQLSLAVVLARDKESDFQSSTNQTAVSGSASTTSHKPVVNSPNFTSRSTNYEGRVSLISPVLGLEAQLFSSFAADVYEPKKSTRRGPRRSSAEHHEVCETLTDNLDLHSVQRHPGSVSRTPRNILNEGLQAYRSNLHLKDVISSLYPCIPKFSPSESATPFGHQQKSSDTIGVQYSNIFPPPRQMNRSQTLLSTVFFDQELKSLIDNNFHLSHVPRDKSLVEAVKISDQISCTLDQQYRNSVTLPHIVLSGQESQFLSNLYVEPEHLDISNTSISSQWILELQRYHGKVRTPMPTDFQRRTYFNMSEHDERRAPTALWHFDNANSLQHTDKLTESPQAQTHVAYATATDTRRYSSYYSDQGVHSSPGDTSVALNFGFQTRTNYPFRKTYRHTQRSGKVSHKTRGAPLDAALSFDAVKSREFSAQALAPASQDLPFFDASDTDSKLRDPTRTDDETPVYSINEEGKLIARKD